MHILRLVYEWPPPWDGLASGIYELTQAQINLGNEVEVFSSKRFPRAPKRFSLFLTTAPAVLVGYIFYRLRGKRFDVIHGHGHITACFNLYKLLFGWLDKTAYILHLHIAATGREVRAREQKTKLDFWTKYFEWPLHKFSDKIGCRVSDAIICSSKQVREEAIKYYQAGPDKTFAVENGVNTQLFARPRKTRRVYPSTRRVGELAERQNLLYVGALSERKNAHLLIEAMKFLPDEYHLTIAGRGDKEYEDRLHRLVEDLKLHERVKFVGYVEYPKLSIFYQNADLLVLPSSYEGFPKVVLEALSCGTSVLASGFQIKESISGLHFLKDVEPKNLAEEIKKVVERREVVDTKSIRQKYSWEMKAKEIQEIYDRIKKR